jgi:hypothetical protein
MRGTQTDARSSVLPGGDGPRQVCAPASATPGPQARSPRAKASSRVRLPSGGLFGGPYSSPLSSPPGDGPRRQSAAAAQRDGAGPAPALAAAVMAAAAAQQGLASSSAPSPAPSTWGLRRDEPLGGAAMAAATGVRDSATSHRGEVAEGLSASELRRCGVWAGRSGGREGLGTMLSTRRMLACLHAVCVAEAGALLQRGRLPRAMRVPQEFPRGHLGCAVTRGLPAWPATHATQVVPGPHLRHALGLGQWRRPTARSVRLRKRRCGRGRGSCGAAARTAERAHLGGGARGGRRPRSGSGAKAVVKRRLHWRVGGHRVAGEAG